MKDRWKKHRTHAFICLSLLVSGGCGPSFKDYRIAGQRELRAGNYGGAQGVFQAAYGLNPEDAQNLYDLGVCRMRLADQRFKELNWAAAVRELDRAIEYFSRAVQSHPGHQLALVAKNQALELRGKYQGALADARWAARNVGPSARQQVFLARNLEERGDLDSALVAYKQAVAMEPENAWAQAEMGRFYMRIQENDLAVQHLQEARDLNPKEPGVAEDLAALGASP